MAWAGITTRRWRWNCYLATGVSVGAVAGVGAAAEAVVDGLAALEAGFYGVPVLDGRFARLPAEKDDFAIDVAGEIEQAGVEIFDLNTDFVDFSKGFAGALDLFFEFGAARGDFSYVDVHASGEVNAAGEIGKFIVDLLGGPFAFEGAIEEGLDEREHGLSFV
jgi:hypothetical protein